MSFRCLLKSRKLFLIVTIYLLFITILVGDNRSFLLSTLTLANICGDDYMLDEWVSQLRALFILFLFMNIYLALLLSYFGSRRGTIFSPFFWGGNSDMKDYCRVKKLIDIRHFYLVSWVNKIYYSIIAYLNISISTMIRTMRLGIWQTSEGIPSLEILLSNSSLRLVRL